MIFLRKNEEWIFGSGAIYSNSADIVLMGKLLLVIAVVAALAIAGGAYYYFFYGEDSLSAEIDEDAHILVVKGPNVDMKLSSGKITQITLGTYGSLDTDMISGLDNSKVRSGEFKFGIYNCTANYYKNVDHRITISYERDNELMPGDATGRLVINLDTVEKTDAFATALAAHVGILLG